MSFFNKLFGGDEKKPEPKVAKAPPQPQTNEIEQKKIKIQAAVNQLDVKINEFEDKEKKFQHKIDILKAKARELLQADKKKEAKKYVEEATRIQKQMESYTLRKKALVDKKFELQQAAMDMDTIDAIEGAHQHIKGQQKYTDKLQDIILDTKEAKMHQNQINDKLKDLVEHSEEDEEVDDMLNDLMADIKKDKIKKVEQKKNVDLDLPQKQINKAKNKEEDDIAKMLADLN